MNILYTLDSGAPGGMEYHTRDLIRGMVKRGHTVYVWCKQGIMADLYKKAGAVVFEKKIRFDLDLVYIYELSKFLVQKNIQILHSHELRATGTGLLAAFVAQTPVKITHIHTPLSEWPVTKFKKKVYTFFYSRMVNMLAAKEIALTESKKRIKLREGIKDKNLVVIGNGVDLHRFKPIPMDKANRYIHSNFSIPEDTYLFGSMSRLTQEKGLFSLVRGYKLFIDKNDDKKNSSVNCR